MGAPRAPEVVMKIEMPAKNFLDSLSVVGSVIPAHAAKPILSMVKIEAREDRLELVATDLEVGIREAVAGVQVKEPGMLLVPMAQLAGMFREAAPDVPATLASDGAAARVSYGRSRFKVYGGDPGEFPEVPSLDTEDFFEVPGPRLREMIRRTHFATAHDNPYFALNGVHIHAVPRQLDVVATDGRRLAMVTLREGVEVKAEKGAVLPVKTVLAVERVLAEAGAEAVRLHLGENRFVARTSRATVMSKVLEGSFPNYMDIVPSDLPISIELGREEFLGALRRAAILADDENRLVKLALGPNELSLKAANPGVGESEVSLEVAYSGGQPFETNFNAVYIQDALKAAAAERIMLRLGTAEDFGRLELGDGYVYVIAPVQLA